MQEGRAVMGDAGSIGSRVRQARLYRRLTLAELSGLVGRSKGWLSMVENGRVRLDKRSDIAMLAEVLDVSAADLLGTPSPAIPPVGHGDADVVRLREVLLESSLDDPLPVEPRPLEEIEAALAGPLHRARRDSDYATLSRILPDILAETHVLAARSTSALTPLVELSVCATFTLRHLGQGDLAWIAAERAQLAAGRLGEPVGTAAAAFARAHARPAAARSRALLAAADVADELSPHLSNVRGHQVYGMLLLTAALARQVSSDHTGAQDYLAEAARVADRLGEQPAAWQSFGPANVNVWGATIATEVGDASRALACAEAVPPGVLSKGRRATLAIEQARAAAMMDRPDAAARGLRSAERLSPARVYANPLVHELVRDIVERPLKDPVLRGLAWRLGVID